MNLTWTGILGVATPFVIGFALSLTLFIVAMIVSRRLRRYSLHKAAAAEASDHGNVNAGRGWATAAQLLPYVVYAIALMLSVSLLPIDISAIVGALAAGMFGIALAVQDVLKGLAAKFIIVGSDIFRPGDVVEYAGAILTVIIIGQTHTEFLDHARDARLIVPNATLVVSDIRNFDDVQAAKMVMILPIDSKLKSFQLDELEASLSKAIERFSVGLKKASARYINMAGDAAEFRLVGFTTSPTQHPDAMPAMYKAAHKAALDMKYSVGRTNNNSFGNPLQLVHIPSGEGASE